MTAAIVLAAGLFVAAFTVAAVGLTALRLSDRQLHRAADRHQQQRFNQ